VFVLEQIFTGRIYTHPQVLIASLLGLGFAAGPALLDLTEASFLLLLHALLVKALVLLCITLGNFTCLALAAGALPLVLKHERGYKTLDLGGLILLLAVLGVELTADHVSADVILLVEVEKLADVVGTLRSETTGNGAVSEAFNFGITLLEDNKVDGGKVGTDDAATDGLTFALTLSAGAVARSALVEEEGHTDGREHTLLHGETLLVITARDAENVALELFAKFVTLDFSGHALVVEDTELLFVIALDALL